MSENEINDNLMMLKCFLQEEGDENWKDYCNAIQGILDLYQKEKEKNKKYKESITFLENKIINQRYYIKTGIIEKKLNVDSLCKTFDLISKDKIREKQMYYEKMLREEKWGEKTELGVRNRIVALQELLEK